MAARLKTIRTITGAAALCVAMGFLAGPAAARTHHRRAGHDLVVTRGRGLAVPPDPMVAATPNFTGQNGKTTDVNVFPDLAVGDGFYGFQTPSLSSYGFAGGGLTPYQLQ